MWFSPRPAARTGPGTTCCCKRLCPPADSITPCCLCVLHLLLCLFQEMCHDTCAMCLTTPLPCRRRRYLLNQMDAEAIAKAPDASPLMEISLELAEPNVVWFPELAEGSDGNIGIRDMVKGWLKSFLDIGLLMKRLDIGEGNYLKDLEEDFEVYNYMSQVMGVIMANEGQCEEFKQQYMKYEYLWRTDLQASLAEFREREARTLSDGSKDDPELSKFQEQIAKYKAVIAEVEHLPSARNMGWLRISAKPLKSSLGNWAHKWVYLYTKYLQEKVVADITDLYDFIDRTSVILDQKIPGEGEDLMAEMEAAAEAAEAEEELPEGEEPLTAEEKAEIKAKEHAEKIRLLYEVRVICR